MKRKPKRQKSVTIQMRAFKADVALFDRAAKALGITRSALIRHAAEAHALRVLTIASTRCDP